MSKRITISNLFACWAFIACFCFGIESQASIQPLDGPDILPWIECELVLSNAENFSEEAPADSAMASPICVPLSPATPNEPGRIRNLISTLIATSSDTNQQRLSFPWHRPIVVSSKPVPEKLCFLFAPRAAKFCLGVLQFPD